MELDGPYIVASQDRGERRPVVGGGHNDGLIVGDGVEGVSEVGERAVAHASQQRVRPTVTREKPTKQPMPTTKPQKVTTTAKLTTTAKTKLKCLTLNSVVTS